MDTILIAGAIKEEINGILNKVKVDAIITRKPSTFYRGTYKDRPIIVVRTGIGEGKAFDAIDYITKIFPVGAVISTGYAGATTPDSVTGELVISPNVIKRDAAENPPIDSDKELFDLACQIATKTKLKFKTGSSIMVPLAVGDPKEKAFLGAGTGAVGIEMESYAVAKASAKNNVKFLAVRSILDTLNFSFPDTSYFLSPDNEIRKGKVFSYIIQNPRSIADLAKIANMAGKARHSLTKFFEEFVPSL